jgi:hypothetical protein
MADYSMANWYASQRTPSYMRMANYGTPVAAGSPDVPTMIGADYEQMPANMPAYSAVNAPITSTPSPAAADPGMMSSFSNWLRTNGWIDSIDPATGQKLGGMGGLALGAVQGLGSLYLGMQQYNLAKDQLAFQKGAFERQFANQKQSMNTQLEDRQRARVASNAGAYQSVGDYMAQNGVK